MAGEGAEAAEAVGRQRRRVLEADRGRRPAHTHTHTHTHTRARTHTHAHAHTHTHTHEHTHTYTHLHNTHKTIDEYLCFYAYTVHRGCFLHTTHKTIHTDAYASMHIPCMVTERTLAVRSRSRQGAHARNTRNYIILYYIISYCIVLWPARRPRTTHAAHKAMHEYSNNARMPMFLRM